MAKLKVEHLCKILEIHIDCYKQSHQLEKADALLSFISLLKTNETKTVSSFAKLLKDKWANSKL